MNLDRAYGASENDEIRALEEQADELIDASRIEDALALCHRIIREHGPTYVILHYILLCEELEQLARIRRIVAQYPLDFVAAMAEIDILRRFRTSQARHRCTIQLESENWTSEQRVQFRGKRLEATIKGSRPDHFLEDLTFIADLRLGTKNDKIILKHFARMIVKIGRPSFVEPLRSLAEKFAAFEKLTRLIHLKIQELELLEEIQADAGRGEG